MTRLVTLDRKRRKKEENKEERKKKRLERLIRKQERLKEVQATLESNLDDEAKEEKIKIIEGKKKVEAKPKEVVEEKADEKQTGRDWTLSIALPGSILDNAQSPELRYCDKSIFQS